MLGVCGACRGAGWPAVLGRGSMQQRAAPARYSSTSCSMIWYQVHLAHWYSRIILRAFHSHGLVVHAVSLLPAYSAVQHDVQQLYFLALVRFPPRVPCPAVPVVPRATTIG